MLVPVREPVVVQRLIAELKRNPRNARTHSRNQRRLIAKSISKFGFLGAIIIDEKDVVLAGQCRLEGAGQAGLTTVPTIQVLGLSEAQKRGFALADNKLAEKAGWDREILAVEFGDLAELLAPLDLSLRDIGFEPGEVDAIVFDHDESKTDPDDDLPPVEGRIVSRTGDLWISGSHRLLCGDSRSPSAYERLMADERADMAFCDPPYNVRVVGHVQGRGKTKHQEFPFASGEMSDEEYAQFLSTCLTHAAQVSREGAVYYVCMDWRHIATLIEIGGVIFGAMLNLCVWTKSNAGQGSFYRSHHELIAVLRVGDEPHQNNVDLGRFGRNRSNVWPYPGGNTFSSTAKSHPTPKPVAMVADAIRDCTAKGALVLDPFMGSGTTLLAAEKVGRRAYGIEYEPGYVDLCIRRWQAYTRRDAVLAGDGRCFDDVMSERDTAARAQTHARGEA